MGKNYEKRVVDMEKSAEENKNSIIFNCSGAIDFSEQINIELSHTNEYYGMKDTGFTEIHPLDLMWKLDTEIKHIQEILYVYFLNITGKIPHISDKNENLPLENRFTKIYYKCYKKFHHSHWHWDKYHYTPLTLDEAIKYIKKENLAIQIPDRLKIIKTW